MRTVWLCSKYSMYQMVELGLVGPDWLTLGRFSLCSSQRQEQKLFRNDPWMHTVSDHYDNYEIQIFGIIISHTLLCRITYYSKFLIIQHLWLFSILNNLSLCSTYVQLLPVPKIHTTPERYSYNKIKSKLAKMCLFFSSL